MESNNPKMASKNVIKFHRFVVTDQVFYKTKYTYALVNLKPITPGHILIVPLRHAPRLKDLTAQESCDYMETIQKIHKFIEYIYKADSMNIAIQDGPEAGQSVPHLHTHVIPRHKASNIGDAIYELMDSMDVDAEYKEFFARKAKTVRTEIKPDSERLPRTEDVMHKEAQWLSEELEKWSIIENDAK